jgi:hypothetical protein
LSPPAKTVEKVTVINYVEIAYDKVGGISAAATIMEVTRKTAYAFQAVRSVRLIRSALLLAEASDIHVEHLIGVIDYRRETASRTIGGDAVGLAYDKVGGVYRAAAIMDVSLVTARKFLQNRAVRTSKPALLLARATGISIRRLAGM